MFTRRNMYVAGNYAEVGIVPLPDEVKYKLSGMGRRRKKRMTRPAQQLVNDKQSFRWMRLVMNGNFFKGDYYLTLTYDENEIPRPENVEDAKSHLRNFLKKARNRYKKEGLEFKYLWVMEYELDDEEKYLIRAHFHLVTNRGVDRDILEDCWSTGRGKHLKKRGYVHARRIQTNGEFGVERLAGYFSKGKRWKKGKKLWNSSTNLDKPQKLHPNDNEYTQRAVEKMFLSNDQGFEVMQKKFPGYFITSIQFVDDGRKGKHMYLRMWKKDPPDKKRKRGAKPCKE